MKNYDVLPPPYVKDGQYLSAYFVNQLSDSVNGSGGFVYGANVARWTYPTTQNVSKDDGVWMFQRRFDQLRVRYSMNGGSGDIKVYIAGDDVSANAVQVAGTTWSGAGSRTLTVNLNSPGGGLSIGYGQMYFVRVQMSKGTPSSDNMYVEGVEEVGVNYLSKPTIQDFYATQIMPASYFNQLVAAARDLRAKVEPYNQAFVGCRVYSSQNRDATWLRWKLRHLSRYLHVSFTAPGGGSNGIKLYINDTELAAWPSNGASVTQIFDMTALPHSIAEPTFGSEYELKYSVDWNSGAFIAWYIWELPYL